MAAAAAEEPALAVAAPTSSPVPALTFVAPTTGAVEAVMAVSAVPSVSGSPRIGEAGALTSTYGCRVKVMLEVAERYCSSASVPVAPVTGSRN